MEKIKRRPGDRRDARLIRDIDALHLMMGHLYLDRTANEAYISQTVDLEPIKKWIDAHPDEELKYSFFHIFIAAFLKLLIEKPKLNRFVADRKFYQRNDTTVSFIVKRQFTEEAKEGMALISAEDTDTVFSVHEKPDPVVQKR